MKKILIIGMFRFPYGDAPANRYIALAKSVIFSGHEVLVVANGSALNNQNGVLNEDGVDYLTIRSDRDDFFSKALRRLFPAFFFYKKLKYFSSGKINYVIVSRDSLSLQTILLCKFVLKSKIIVDCMEWFDPNQFSRGVFSFGYLKFFFNFNFVCHRVGNVIGISKMICNKFNKVGCNVINIPPQIILDNFIEHVEIEDINVVKIFYAGSVGKKDYLGVVLKGIMLLSPSERMRIVFTIAGPSREEVEELFMREGIVKSEIYPCINILGKIPRSSVLSELSKSHFTVLLRPIARYSSAGFPSKIPESLAAGTPIMANITSDLGDYLVDGVNSVIVDGCTPIDFVNALRRALNLSISDIKNMSDAARKCARDNFDYVVAAKNIDLFLSNVK